MSADIVDCYYTWNYFRSSCGIYVMRFMLLPDIFKGYQTMVIWGTFINIFMIIITFHVIWPYIEVLCSLHAMRTAWP